MAYQVTFSYLFNIFWLESGCLTMLYEFLLHIKVSQLCIHIHALLFGLPSIQVTTERWVEFPVLYSRFSVVISFVQSSVYVSVLLSQFIPPLVSIHLFSISVSLFILPEQLWVWETGLSMTVNHVHAYWIYFPGFDSVLHVQWQHLIFWEWWFILCLVWKLWFPTGPHTPFTFLQMPSKLYIS